MAGDSWGFCAIPIVEAEPATFIIFFGALGSVLMGFGNLILAVIVARAEEARQADVAQRVKDKAAESEKEKNHLLKICQRMDKNRNDCISLDELLAAYDAKDELYEVIHLMDVERDELCSLLKMLDELQTGDVFIPDFVNSLFK